VGALALVAAGEGGAVTGRHLLAWLAGAVAAYVVGGWVSGATVVVVAVLDLLGRAQPRVVLATALGVLLVLPFAWLVGNAPRMGRVSFDLVAKVPLVGVGGLVALTLLCVGVTLDLSRQSPSRHDEESA
jgi:hypothetical protein